MRCLGQSVIVEVVQVYICLGNQPVPQVHWEVWINATYHRDDVAFSGLDSFLGNVPPVIIWPYNLIDRAIIIDDLLKIRRCFIVEDVVLRLNTA